MRSCVGYVELSVSTTGLALVALGPSLIVPDGSFWKATAISAVALVVVHALLLVFIRWKHQFYGELVVNDVRKVLNDVVNNRLAMIRLRLEASDNRIAADELEAIRNDINEISATVGALNGEVVHEWKEQYPDAGNASSVQGGACLD